jgi:hypothetical protein
LEFGLSHCGRKLRGEVLSIEGVEESNWDKQKTKHGGASGFVVFTKYYLGNQININ